MSLLKYLGIENTTPPSDMSQRDLVMNHLRSGKSISQLEALNLYGCLRLAVIINILRKRGNEIETLRIPHKGSSYARYKLIKEAK